MTFKISRADAVRSAMNSMITEGFTFTEEEKKLLNLEDIDTGDLINLEDEPNENFQEIKKVLFKFRVKVGCYIC